MKDKSKHIVIVGAGPAGCALACFLCQAGVKVTVFDSGLRPDLIVGESLIPAAVPLLQRLGIESEIASISSLKPGASLFHHSGTRVDFNFRAFGRRAPDYAYNIPRPEFDHVLRRRAETLGARFIAESAKLTVNKDHQSREIELAPESIKAAGLEHGNPPTLLVDATGRARLFSRLLKVPSARGSRNDVAYFAHYQNFRHDEVKPGQIIISILKHGWSWRIPLPDRLSVGVVLDRGAARRFGSNATERLENIIANESLLSRHAQGAKRITEVKSYSNYQQRTEQGAGPGWVMAGDAFGFVDPMLSPGVFMALESASILGNSIARYVNTGKIAELNKYCDAMDLWHDAWQEAIEYLYDGRLLHLHESGAAAMSEGGNLPVGKFLDWYYRRVVALIISGVGTRSVFQRRMLARAASHFLEEGDSQEMVYAVVDA